MASVRDIAELLLELAGDPSIAEELARAIVALDGEATKETRVMKAAETR